MSVGYNIGPEDFEVESHTCQVCSRTFGKKSGLKRHQTRMGHKVVENVMEDDVVIADVIQSDHTLVQIETADVSTSQEDPFEITVINNNVANENVQLMTSSTPLQNPNPRPLLETSENSEDEFFNQARCRFCNKEFKGLKGVDVHLRRTSCGEE